MTIVHVSYHAVDASVAWLMHAVAMSEAPRLLSEFARLMQAAARLLSEVETTGTNKY